MFLRQLIHLRSGHVQWKRQRRQGGRGAVKVQVQSLSALSLCSSSRSGSGGPSSSMKRTSFGRHKGSMSHEFSTRIRCTTAYTNIKASRIASSICITYNDGYALSSQTGGTGGIWRRRRRPLATFSTKSTTPHSKAGAGPAASQRGGRVGQRRVPPPPRKKPHERFVWETSKFPELLKSHQLPPYLKLLSPDESQWKPEDVNYSAYPMHMTFLGTGSGRPSDVRGVSGMVMRAFHETWLFDCGDGTAKQLDSPKVPNPDSKISRIFITHVHGDHLWGLPSVLAGISHRRKYQKDTVGAKKLAKKHLKRMQDLHRMTTEEREKLSAQKDRSIQHQKSDKEVDVTDRTEIAGPIRFDGQYFDHKLDIYAPYGVRAFVESAMAISQCKIDMQAIRWHEFLVPEWRGGLPMDFKQDSLPIHFPDTTSAVVLEDNPTFTVSAVLLKHTVPCYGFIIQEHPRPGRLDMDKAFEKYNLSPGTHLQVLKQGMPITNDEGVVVNPSDVVGPPIPGRKVVILGDTSDASTATAAAADATLVVHEATSDTAGQRFITNRGHSTSAMAGRFARKIGAKHLILNHFGGYFNPHSAQLHKLFREARQAAGPSVRVQCAQDLTTVWLGAFRS